MSRTAKRRKMDGPAGPDEEEEDVHEEVITPRATPTTTAISRRRSSSSSVQKVAIDSRLERANVLLAETIEVWWESEEAFFTGKVVDADEEGIITVLYVTDGVDEESFHDLDKTVWRWPEKKTRGPRKMPVSSTTSTTSTTGLGSGAGSGSGKKRAVKMVAPIELAEGEDVMDRPEFAKLSEIIEGMFDAHDQRQGISSKTISLLQRELAKTKRTGLLHWVEPRTLTRVLDILDAAISDSRRSPWDDGENATDITDGFQAAVAACCIMTVPEMPKQVYQEDLVKSAVGLLRHHLNKTIYPWYHPDAGADADDADADASTPTPSKRRNSATPGKSASKADRRSSFGGGGGNSIPTPVLKLYSVACELVDAIAELLQVETAKFDDSIVLEISDTVVSAFFQEGALRDLQSRSLNVARTVFAYYPTHRQVILDDVLLSLSKIPNSKRGTRAFRVGSVDIQMISALLVQLVQSSTTSVMKATNDSAATPIQFRQAFDESESVSKIFLTNVIERCTSKKDDGDLKAILSTVTHDLLQVLFLPEWPAAERILHIMTRQLLIKSKAKTTAGAQPTPPVIRSFALELLGKIAAKLRSEKLIRDKLKASIRAAAEKGEAAAAVAADPVGGAQWNGESEGVSAAARYTMAAAALVEAQSTGQAAEALESTQGLQDLLLGFLDSTAIDDPSVLYARNYCVCRWIESEHKAMAPAAGSLTSPAVTSSREQRQAAKEEEEKAAAVEDRSQALIERMKNANLVDNLLQDESALLGEDLATTASRLLANAQVLDRNFDTILSHIIAALKERETGVRSKALKALAAIVDEDCSVLSNGVVKKAVEERFTDIHISVREAAVDLVGKFVLLRPDLTAQYYKNFVVRLKDKGISVRKRSIQVLRDICIQQPTFPNIRQVCCELLRKVAVDSSEGIKKLARQSFEQMWFTMPSEAPPAADGTKRAMTPAIKKDLLKRRVLDITQVLVGENEKTHFVKLIQEYLDKPTAAMTQTCAAMVACAVEAVVATEVAYAAKQIASTARLDKLMGLLKLLFVFCQAKASLLVKHTETLSPFMKVPITSAEAQPFVSWIQFYTASILAKTLPIIPNPTANFLKNLEESAVAGVLKAKSQSVVEECVKCLKSCVEHSNSSDIVKSTLEQFYVYLKDEIEGNNHSKNRPWLLRCLFASGLICRYFNLDEQEDQTGKYETYFEADDELRDDCITHVVFRALLEFAVQPKTDLVCRKLSLVGLGHMFIRHPRLMIREDMIDFYVSIMGGRDATLKRQVLTNMTTLLQDEETRSKERADAAINDKAGPVEDLTEIGNADSGTSGIMLSRLEQHILDATISPDPDLHHAAFVLLKSTLNQGLVHPMNTIPPLIALATLPAGNAVPTKDQAQQQLSVVYANFPALIYQKALEGSQLAFTFQKRIAVTAAKKTGASTDADADLRPSGYRSLDATHRSSALSAIYSLMRPNKKFRRGYMSQLLKLFTAKKVDVEEVAFLAENLASFPYDTQEEPLYVIHTITNIAAVQGTTLQARFEELLGFSDNLDGSEDDDDDEHLEARIKDVSAELKAVCNQTQGVSLLMLVKQYLQRVNGFTELRCDDYKPAEASKSNAIKINRKPVEPMDTSEFNRACETPADVAAHFRAFKNLLMQGEYREFGDDGEDGEAMETKSDTEEPVGELGVSSEEADEVFQKPKPKSAKKKTPAKKKKTSAMKAALSKKKTSAKKLPAKRRNSKDAKAKNKPKKRRKIGDSDESDSDDADWA